MPKGANVTSLEAVQAFRFALQEFGEDAQRALESAGQELLRILEWLDQEAPAYWREQVRRAYRDLSEARVNLEMCKLRSVAGRRPSCIEEQKALEQAKRRLRTCQEKVDIVKSWSARAHQEVDNYRGRTTQLQHYLDRDFLHLIHTTDRRIHALELYTEVAKPVVEETPPKVDDDDVIADEPNTETH